MPRGKFRFKFNGMFIFSNGMFVVPPRRRIPTSGPRLLGTAEHKVAGPGGKTFANGSIRVTVKVQFSCPPLLYFLQLVPGNKID